MVIELLLSELEAFLNKLERHSSGLYDIVSIATVQSVGTRSVMAAVIRFHITSELEFDEEEIKRKLGF
jgi:hypothetical protein